MTIRIRRETQRTVEPEQIAALITQSLLQPSEDDAPQATTPRPEGNWLGWGQAHGGTQTLID